MDGFERIDVNDDNVRKKFELGLYYLDVVNDILYKHENPTDKRVVVINYAISVDAYHQIIHENKQKINDR